MTVKTEVYTDATERKIHFRRVQDVEPVLDANKAMQAVEQRSDWGRHIASIPAVILEKWINEDGVNYLSLPKDEFARLVKRKLRDPDYAWLKTTGKGIGWR